MKVKRISAGVLAVAVVASAAFAVGTAFAAPAASNSVDIIVGDAVAEPGGTFSIDVSLANVPSIGIMGLEFAVSYDASLISVDSITEGALSLDTGAAAEELRLDPELGNSIISGDEYSCLDYYIASEQVRTAWSTGLSDSDFWIKTDGVLMTIHGTVKAGVEPGTEIKLDVVHIERETYPGSGVPNTKIFCGYLNEDDERILYDVNSVSGTVTVSGDVDTTTTSDDSDVTTAEDPDVTTTTSASEVTTTAESETGGPDETTTTQGTTTPGFVPKYGDVNCNGGIGMEDILLLCKALTDQVILTADQNVNACVLGAAEPDVSDALLILRFLCEFVPEEALTPPQFRTN